MIGPGMVNQSSHASDATSRRFPLIEAFGITGLHGSRTISLEATDNVSILIAKNGSGKTTLLGVMNAFLTGQLFRLRSLEFDTVFCKFRGHPDQLVLTRSDLDQAMLMPDSGEIAVAAARIGVTPAALFRFVTEEWPTLAQHAENPHENSTYTSITRVVGYRRPAIDKYVNELRSAAYARNPNVDSIIQATRTALGGHEVLYLPTYRRIELALRDAVKDGRARRRRPFIDISNGGLFTGNIQFGLSDISERLAEMNEQIVYESNRQYRRISADIINGLIDGSFDRHDVASGDIPPREELELFFSRVEQSRQYGPVFNPHIPNIDKIYSNDVSSSSRKFLSYFLSQLNKVMESTKIVETRIETFINICNRYLANEELYTHVTPGDVSPSADGKKLVLNKKTLQVNVLSIPEGIRIPLDALSSGEKQMISLFAKLFLYEQPKIVLIDEPELSLSIDWQRHILVDISKAPPCEQMIAITHSPFVFDNELEPFAGSLRISIRAEGHPQISEDLFFEEEDDFDE